MTKTKSQLRAEAVERLRDTDAWLSTSADLINAMLGDRCEVGMANKRRYLIDLLTDDEPQDGTTPEFDVPLYGWHEGARPRDVDA